MSPEQIQIEELKNQVKVLNEKMRQFESVAGLDPQIIRTITTVLTSASDKTAASATQSVDEAGAATYDVMVAPTGFISIGGLNVPYID